MGLQDPFPIPLTRSSVSVYPVVIPAPAFAPGLREKASSLLPLTVILAITLKDGLSG